MAIGDFSIFFFSIFGALANRNDWSIFVGFSVILFAFLRELELLGNCHNLEGFCN